MYYKILVGYDGSRGGKAALAAAAALARKFEGRVTALWVREPLPRHSDLHGEIEEESEAADRYFAEREKEVAAFAAEHGIPIACDVVTPPMPASWITPRTGPPATALTVMLPSEPSTPK